MIPKVSVIMAVHNGEAHLVEAVDSVLSQTLKDLELIIVDDASTDATAAILAWYSDPRLCILRNPRRSGPGAARNRGLRIARAPLVAVQDADDVSLPYRLEMQVKFLANHPDVDVTAAYAMAISRNGQELGIMRYPPIQDLEIKWALLFWNPFIHSSVVFRRFVLDQTGPYAEKGEFAWLGEDYELLSRISRTRVAANIGQVLIRYRANPDGASAQVSNLQRISEEVSMRNLRWLLGPGVVDEATLTSLRSFWVGRRPLSRGDACRALAGNKLLCRAFQSRYVEKDAHRLVRTRFYVARARQVCRQAVAARAWGSLAAQLFWFARSP